MTQKTPEQLALEALHRNDANLIAEDFEAIEKALSAKWMPLPKGWHVSWMGEDDGYFLCQVKRHDDDLEYLGDISFVSRTSLKSMAEAYDDAVFTVLQEYSPDAPPSGGEV